MKMQSGNCFDLSVLLASLLIGIGCDAYVVSGYATREVTLMDETKTRIPIPEFTSPETDIVRSHYRSHNKPIPKELSNEPETAVSSKYKIKAPRTLKSSFIERQEAKARLAEEKRKQELSEKEARRQAVILMSIK
jgi:hypothetical protein